MEILSESRKFRHTALGRDVLREERVRRSRRDKRKRKSGIPGCREDICVMKYPRDTRTHRPRLFSSGPRVETEEKRRIPVFPSCLRPSRFVLFRMKLFSGVAQKSVEIRGVDYQQREHFAQVFASRFRVPRPRGFLWARVSL